MNHADAFGGEVDSAVPEPFSAAEWQAAQAQALRLLQSQYPGVDFDLMGFRGLVKMRAERLLHEGADTKAKDVSAKRVLTSAAPRSAAKSAHGYTPELF